MDNFDKYLNSTLRFLSYRIRSEKEIRDYLKKKKAPLDFAEKIITSCKNYGFINDEKFAAEWVRSRSNYRLKSKRIIKIELLKKGIDPEIIEKALNPEDKEDVNDSEQIRKLIEKRLPRYKGLPRNVLYQKLGGFLARRGFEWDTIKKSIDDVLKSGYNK